MTSRVSSNGNGHVTHFQGGNKAEKSTGPKEQRIADIAYRNGICRDFLKGGCTRKSCKYEHPARTLYDPGTYEKPVRANKNGHVAAPQPPEHEEKEKKANNLNQKIAKVCKFFIKGRCTKEACKFEHPSSTPVPVTTAADTQPAPLVAKVTLKGLVHPLHTHVIKHTAVRMKEDIAFREAHASNSTNKFAGLSLDE